MATKAKTKPGTKAAGNPLKERRLHVQATIKVNFITNVPNNISDEDYAREVQVLIRGMAASAPITIDDIRESTPTGLRAYMAGIADSSDNWLFQGIVVAKDKDEAKKVLAAWKKGRNEYAKGRCEVSVPFMESAGIPTNKTKGVYEETNFSNFEA